MKRLAVMAHYDPRGLVAPHVRRQVRALAESVDRLVVVTTAQLEDGARSFLAGHGELVERANYGYDFFSYRTGLRSQDLAAYDEVTVCNDSYVGPLRPYAEVFSTMEREPVDFWGLTETDRVSHHVQSFFVTFRAWVVGSRAFETFWSEMAPLSRRGQVIRQYEVGMSTNLYDAGFASGAFFRETPADRELARRRVRWWALRRTGLPTSAATARLLRTRAQEPWNPSAGLADAALDDGRLPYVKIDTLRYDPYGLGSRRLLALCEERHPAAFDGVRDWLVETDRFYPPRPTEQLLPVPVPLRPLRRVVEYRRAR